MERVGAFTYKNNQWLREFPEQTSKMLVSTASQFGKGGYNAQALGYSIFTQGETTEELKNNIMDAVGCHFGGSECWDEVLWYER